MTTASTTPLRIAAVSDIGSLSPRRNLKGDLVDAQVREPGVERQTGPKRRPVEDRGNASQVAVHRLTLSRFPTNAVGHKRIERWPVKVKKPQKVT